MTLTGDTLTLIRQRLYADWTLASPSKTDIGEAGFVVVQRTDKIPASTPYAVTVALESPGPRPASTGYNAPIYHQDIIRLGAWTKNLALLDPMLKEISRVLVAARASPPTGIDDLFPMKGGGPRMDRRPDDSIYASELRFQVWYQT